MAEYEGERDKDPKLEPDYEELEELQGIDDLPEAIDEAGVTPEYETHAGLEERMIQAVHKIAEVKKDEVKHSNETENKAAVSVTPDTLKRAADAAKLNWLAEDKDIQSVDEGSFDAVAYKGTPEDNSRELRDTIQKYLDENELDDYPFKVDRDLWKEFKNNKIDANTFLRECSLSDEFDTHSIELLKIALQSNALHHDTENITKGKFYNTRTLILEKISKTTNLAEQKSIVVNMKQLQDLVNIHGVSDTPDAHKNFILKNVRYLEAIEKNRQRVIASYEGLGNTESEKLARIKRFSAKQYEKGFLGGYKDNENAALENFGMLYGKNCGTAIMEGLRTMHFPKETLEQMKIIKESSVLAWEMERTVVERAFGFKDNELRNMSMVNKLPPDEKAAVNIMLKEIGKGAIISGSMSLGLTFGVGLLSSLFPGAPVAPLVAGGVTVFNIVQHIRGAYNAQYDKLPRDENGNIKDGARVNIADMQIKKVVINALIVSAPVLLASIPFLGAKVGTLIAAGSTTTEIISAVMPFATVFLSLGLAAKGFAQTLSKARKLGIRKLKSTALAALSAVSNYGAASAGAGLGHWTAGVGHDVIVDATDGGGFHPLDIIGNAIKQPIGALAGWFAAKLGLSSAEEAVETNTTPKINELHTQSKHGQEAHDAGESNNQPKIASQNSPPPLSPKTGKSDIDTDIEGVENIDFAKPDALNAKDIERETAAQLAMITAQEKYLGMHKFEEQDFRDFARPVIEKIEKLGVAGLNAFCEYCKMSGKNPILTGPLNWFANTLNVDAKSTKDSDFLDAGSPEFLSFHKLFRESDWEPTEELKSEAWQHLYDRHGTKNLEDHWDNIEGDARAVMAQEMSRKLIEAVNPNSPLLKMTADDLISFREKQREEEIKIMSKVERLNEKYKALTALRQQDAKDRAKFRQEQQQSEADSELPFPQEQQDKASELPPIPEEQDENLPTQQEHKEEDEVTPPPQVRNGKESGQLQQGQDERDRARFRQEQQNEAAGSGLFPTPEQQDEAGSGMSPTTEQQGEDPSPQQTQDEKDNEQLRRDEKDIQRFLQQQRRHEPEELTMGA